MPVMSYPGTLPPESWQLLLDVWSGKTVDKSYAARVAWHCVGFALGKVMPDGPPVVGICAMSGPREKIGKREGAAILAAVAQDPKGDIPWGLILSLALQILERLRKELE